MGAPPYRRPALTPGAPLSVVSGQGQGPPDVGARQLFGVRGKAAVDAPASPRFSLSTLLGLCGGLSREPRLPCPALRATPRAVMGRALGERAAIPARTG